MFHVSAGVDTIMLTYMGKWVICAEMYILNMVYNTVFKSEGLILDF